MDICDQGRGIGGGMQAEIGDVDRIETDNKRTWSCYTYCANAFPNATFLRNIVPIYRGITVSSTPRTKGTFC